MAKVKGKGASSKAGRAEPAPTVSPAERQRMIAEAAYFRAQARGFQSGSPVDDWLAAEAEISRALPPPQQQKEEQAVYERLREEVERRFSEIRDSVDAESVRSAVERAVAEVKAMGVFTGETISKVAETLKKDLASSAAKMGPEWKKFSVKSADAFVVWRDRGRVFLGGAANAVGQWIQQAGRKLEGQTYRAGEMAASGSFECTACGQPLVLKTPGHLPPCANCRNLEYHRV